MRRFLDLVSAAQKYLPVITGGVAATAFSLMFVVQSLTDRVAYDLISIGFSALFLFFWSVMTETWRNDTLRYHVSLGVALIVASIPLQKYFMTESIILLIGAVLCFLMVIAVRILMWRSRRTHLR